jgi:hypothetical protein
MGLPLYAAGTHPRLEPDPVHIEQSLAAGKP